LPIHEDGVAVDERDFGMGLEKGHRGGDGVQLVQVVGVEPAEYLARGHRTPLFKAAD
jgi:hypothetical protein